MQLRLWDEDDVVKELARARAWCEKGKRTMPFVLILVRPLFDYNINNCKKRHKNSYEWVFYVSDCIDRINDLYQASHVILDDNSRIDTSVSHRTSSSSEIEEDAVEDGTIRDESSSIFVGKAMFHTGNTGKPLMKLAGSAGWREALKQKYQMLEALSSICNNSRDKNQQDGDTFQRSTTEQKNDLTAVKAVAAAATGGAAVAGGTTVVAATMGYTASGITAGSYAAGIMAAEAAAAGTGGVAAGGFTAVMQSIGAVGVMANPVGIGLVVVGAVGGLALFGLHLLSQQHETGEQQLEAETEKALQKCIVEATDNATTAATADVSVPQVPYEELAREDKEHKDDFQEKSQCWTVVFAKKLGPGIYCFVPSVCIDLVESKTKFLQVSSDTAAKALLGPTGRVLGMDVDAEHEQDWDGWEMALSLHYDYLWDKGTIRAAAVAAGMYGGSES